MKRIQILPLFVSLLVAAPALHAAISVAPAGTGINTFNAQPAVGDWSTAGIGPSTPGLYIDAATLTTRARQLSASEVNFALGSSSTQPPSPDPLARRNTSATLGLYIQTRPQDNEFLALMATLRNDTGAGASTLTVSYTFNQVIPGPTVVREEVPGHLAFYSLTGAPGSWQAIPQFTSANPGTLTAALNLGNWANGALLYILWIDDNGSAGVIAPEQEGAYTIDNFQAVASGFDGPTGPAPVPSGPRVSVAASGSTAISTFATQPTATEWGTISVGADLPGTYTTADALAARVIAVTNSTAVNADLGTSSTQPPSSDSLARRNTAANGLYIQTRTTGNEYTLLMASLKNDTGATVPALRVSYDLGLVVAAGAVVTEEIPGHLAFFSLTGAPGSWQRIPEFSTGTPGTLTATLNLGNWANGSLLYILWADDNGSVGTTVPNVEGAYTIDNFQAVVTAAAATPPVFTAQPAAQTIASGSSVVFTAAATGATSYKWQRNGADIPGATSATLVVTNATSAQAGTYTSVATNSTGATLSTSATLTVASAAPADVGRLINLAIRTNAGTGAQTLTVGFVVGGPGTSGPTPLLVRGVGPSLGQFGLTGLLANPIATMFQGATVVSTNDNWSGADITARAVQVGAFPLLASSLDAALAVSPAPRDYTVQVTGGTGLALAEIYDATASSAVTATTSRLINVSARTQVGTEGNILIAGFVVGGTTAKTVLIRAIGPGLTGFGVTGTLVDPRLQLFTGSTLIRENDNWGGDAQLTAVGTSVGAFALADAASRDAVLLVTLSPGNYTAQVSGVASGTGIALVEIYDVP